MTKLSYRIAHALVLVSLTALASPVNAQRAHQGAGNRNATVNRNTNVSRNVNVNVNHNWGRARVHAGAYAWPRGYAYGRRSIGYIVPRPLLASTYIYSSYAALGLAAPHAGHQWVRYGDDLLLVEMASGRVVDIRYGVFG